MYTLGDIARKSALMFSEREATVFKDFRFTYQQLNQRVNQLAHALSGMGYNKGDRLTILGENTYKYLEIYFAAAKLGMCSTPLNFRLSDAEIEHIVNDSEAECFLVGDTYEERAYNLKDRLPNIKDWIALDKPLAGYVFYEELIKDASTEEPLAEVDEDEMAVLIYTGGTTGLPKGVMLSHRNMLTALISYVLSIGFTKNDVTCFPLPLFHVSFWPALCCLMVGGKVVIGRRPDLKEILQLIQDERCTHINAVPTLYGWLLQFPDLDTYDLSSLRLITYAGSPFPPETLKQCIRKFGTKFSQPYAMTEAFACTVLPEEDHVLEGEKSRLLASAGRPNFCAEVRVVDENDTRLSPGEIGEVVQKGKHVMMGYWKNPELTAQTIRDGWYHTGDMGYMD
ncbi:MAG: AMP-binding protein, partial [Pseudomonadota bacterium]